ncbi:MAG: hypothetical protein IPK82_06765 [Polyangiaceae bacterium]|nr:hypothetical protein [Polyangiaceae bacterium]
MRAAVVLAIVLSLVGCIPPVTPMERLQQSAHDVANALRFGRTDIAADYVASSARDEFLTRHMLWNDKTRVVDMELLGIFVRTQDEAEAILSVSWLHEDGAMLHTTQISQRWRHEGGSYHMVNELYRSGDKALFDMLPKKEEPKTPSKAATGDAANKG